MIPSWGISRLWFSGGVIAGGLLIAALLTQDESLKVNTTSAVIGGLASAGAFLLCFDKKGEWQWVLSIPAIVVAGIIAVALKVPVLGGVAGFLFYLILGYIALLIRYILIALMALAADFSFGLLEKHFSLDGRIQKSFGFHSLFVSTLWKEIAAAAAALIILMGAYAVSRSWRAQTEKSPSTTRVIIGSKDFAESVVLAEIVAQILEARGVQVERQFELGGTLPHTSLLSGKIDAYPEYTGTAFTAILKHKPITDPRAVYEQVKREYAEQFQVHVGPGLGFQNDFAILVRGAEARRLHLKTISDAVPNARQWRAGFGQDFTQRADGYPGFVKAYGLQFAEQPHEMDLSLSYIALASGKVDLIAGNSTEGRILALDLVQLEDDRHYFPPYEAVYLVRKDSLARVPVLRDILNRLSDAISTEEMRGLNYEVDGKKRGQADVVREWRQRKGF